MPRSCKIIGFLIVAILGVYGCAKGPVNSASGDSNSKTRKLEEDYQAAVKARDEFRLKLAAAEERQTKTAKELEDTRTEREALKGQVTARIAERDALQIQYEKFRTNLKELLGTADAAVNELKLPAPKPQPDQRARK